MFPALAPAAVSRMNILICFLLTKAARYRFFYDNIFIPVHEFALTRKRKLIYSDQYQTKERFAGWSRRRSFKAGIGEVV
jgi:hypothetical protein